MVVDVPSKCAFHVIDIGFCCSTLRRAAAGRPSIVTYRRLGAAGQPMERQRGPEVDHGQGAVLRQDEQGGGHERIHDGGVKSFSRGTRLVRCTHGSF